ncbi:hypothetical protein AMTRI_Chr05g68170 [Amborella trichopoda]
MYKQRPHLEHEILGMVSFLLSTSSSVRNVLAWSATLHGATYVMVHTYLENTIKTPPSLENTKYVNPPKTCNSAIPQKTNTVFRITHIGKQHHFFDKIISMSKQA